MRKRFKKKLRSCAMCKPWKMCSAHRWAIKDMDALNRAEKEIHEAKRV